MRKIAFFAAVAATLCTVACNKDFSSTQTPAPIPDEDGRVEVRLSIKGDAPTKSANQDIDAELSEIKSVQFFAFNSDDEKLDAYVKVTGTNEGVMRVKAGQKKYWAVVNAPDLTQILTLNDLKNTQTLLSDNTNGFVMVGQYNSNATDVPIPVSRIATRVILKKVTAAFTNPAEAAMDCILKRIYLINVVGDAKLYGDSTPTIWHAKRQYEEVYGLTEHLNTVLSPGHNLKNGAYEIPSIHYCYPNLQQPDTQSTTWSPRFTRIVAEVELGGTTYYYPINLQYINSNKSYEIENLTITRKGSTDPDIPITVNDGTFDISVANWTVVPVTSGVNI